MTSIYMDFCAESATVTKVKSRCNYQGSSQEGIGERASGRVSCHRDQLRPKQRRRRDCLLRNPPRFAIPAMSDVFTKRNVRGDVCDSKPCLLQALTGNYMINTFSIVWPKHYQLVNYPSPLPTQLSCWRQLLLLNETELNVNKILIFVHFTVLIYQYPVFTVRITVPEISWAYFYATWKQSRFVRERAFTGN